MNSQKIFQARAIFLLIILLLAIASGNSLRAAPPVENIKYVGVRSSCYGIAPFPNPQEWGYAMDAMTGCFKGAQPMAIWLVGAVNTTTGDADLEFPSPGGWYSKITFTSYDKHENYLNYFDSNGIKVLLQVEPGFADVRTLIDLVLNHYGSHPCVAGFGVDAEWYRNFITGRPGTHITDMDAAVWEAEIKSFNQSYRLFIKHYDKSYLCPTYRGDLIFVDDSQQFAGINEFIADMSDFAAQFYPNPVLYQIGYENDKSWWRKYDNPAVALGKRLADQTRQACGIIWVDFTLRELLSRLHS